MESSLGVLSIDYRYAGDRSQTLKVFLRSSPTVFQHATTLVHGCKARERKSRQSRHIVLARRLRNLQMCESPIKGMLFFKWRCNYPGVCIY